MRIGTVCLLIFLAIGLLSNGIADLTPVTTLTGSGPQETDEFPLEEGLIYFSVDYAGEDNFYVFLHDTGGDVNELLAHGTGPGSSSRAVHIPASGDYFLEVSGNDSWEVTTLIPDTKSSKPFGSVSGNGNYATLPAYFEEGLQQFDVIDTGTSNCIVHLLDQEGDDIALLVNEIGPINGVREARIPSSGSYLFNIESEGEWEISLVSDSDDQSAENLEEDTGEISEISFEVFSDLLPEGEELTISGSVLDYPDNGVAAWIIGDSKAWYRTEPVLDDNTFTFTIPVEMMNDLPAGTYTIIVEHPMEDGIFEVFPEYSGDMSEIHAYEGGDNATIINAGQRTEMDRDEIVMTITGSIERSDDMYALAEIEIPSYQENADG